MAMLVKPLDAPPGTVAEGPILPAKKPTLVPPYKSEDQFFQERLIAHLEKDLYSVRQKEEPVKSQLTVVKPAQGKSLFQEGSKELEAWLATANFDEQVKRKVCLLDVPGCTEIHRKATLHSEAERAKHSTPLAPTRAPDWSDYVSNKTKGWWGSRPPTLEELFSLSKVISRKLPAITGFASLSRWEEVVKSKEATSSFATKASNDPVIPCNPNRVARVQALFKKYLHCHALKHNVECDLLDHTSRIKKQVMYHNSIRLDRSLDSWYEADRLTKWLIEHDAVWGKSRNFPEYMSGLQRFFRNTGVPVNDTGYVKSEDQYYELGRYNKFLKERCSNNWCEGNYDNYLSYVYRVTATEEDRLAYALAPEDFYEPLHDTVPEKHVAEQFVERKYKALTLEAKRLRQGKITREQYLKTLEYFGVVSVKPSSECTSVVPVGEVEDVYTHTFDKERKLLTPSRYAYSFRDLNTDLQESFTEEELVGLTTKIDIITEIDDAVKREMYNALPVVKLYIDREIKSAIQRLEFPQFNSTLKDQSVEGYYYTVGGILVKR